MNAPRAKLVTLTAEELEQLVERAAERALERRFGPAPTPKEAPVAAPLRPRPRLVVATDLDRARAEAAAKRFGVHRRS